MEIPERHRSIVPAAKGEPGFGNAQPGVPCGERGTAEDLGPIGVTAQLQLDAVPLAGHWLPLGLGEYGVGEDSEWGGHLLEGRCSAAGARVLSLEGSEPFAEVVNFQTSPLLTVPSGSVASTRQK